MFFLPSQALSAQVRKSQEVFLRQMFSAGGHLERVDGPLLPI